MHCQPPLHLPYMYVLNQQLYLTRHDKQNYKILVLPSPLQMKTPPSNCSASKPESPPVMLQHHNTPTDPHFLLLLGSRHNILLGPSGYTKQDCLFLLLFHSADPQYSQRDPSNHTSGWTRNLGSPTDPLWRPYSLV